MRYSMIKFVSPVLALGAFALLPACASVEYSSREVANVVASDNDTRHGPHLVTRTSVHDFATTLENARATIDKRGFKTFAVIDHSAGAASIGETLRPTTLIIFGNPKGGTPLMQSAQTMGIALPLKMLVYVNDRAEVIVSWPDMAHIFKQHGVRDRDVVLGKVEMALAAIASEASGQ